ncbi:hypothetical protein K432DRAFT_393315 [Lepidopterella palustris CBS 459.81]|uniref:Uncharacterized protein n=1 Tax=Lepidopterella palustris CBS 459.81 TaxID=1314670 RepID=A0A8E2EAE4_9PEZI|nr:hypothetical protein K432DRAFT_393315 [Lepidopterella palustris CBS 459.81]
MAPNTTPPPSYDPPSYGTIEVREVHEVHHHHTPRIYTHRNRNCCTSCCRALFLTFLILLLTACFAALAFAAWNFWQLSQCEKDRLPWEKECRDYLKPDRYDR